MSPRFRNDVFNRGAREDAYNKAVTEADARRRRDRLEYVSKVHQRHVLANGTGGHTARDEWRNCMDAECASVREISDAKK